MEARRPPSRLAKGKPPLETSASPENLAFRPLRELCSSNLPFCRFTVPRTTRVIRRVIRRIVDLQLNNCDKRAGERERERAGYTCSTGRGRGNWRGEFRMARHTRFRTNDGKQERVLGTFESAVGLFHSQPRDLMIPDQGWTIFQTPSQRIKTKRLLPRVRGTSRIFEEHNTLSSLFRNK